MNNLLYKLNILIFLSVSCVMNGNGSIILINGHGSVGKSSISACLEKLFSDDAVFIGFDNQVLWPHAKKEALKLGLLKDSMTLEEQQKVLMECRYKIIDEKNWMDFVREFHTLARALTEKYRYVILDTVLGVNDIDVDNGQDVQDFVEKMQGINVFTVFVYASPSVHAQHLVERNCLPGYKNKRPILTMKDFFCMYKPATADGHIVDVLTKQEVERALEVLHNNLTEMGEPQDFIQKNIAEIRELYNKMFFVEKQDCVSIAPHLAYDMVVDTGKLSSQECALLIYKQFFAKQNQS
ncbi:MAG: hypothetical protein NTZ68_04200 [Candidatus Dependentiae bacterium]|nr:hypothetical protein [Candidatus Dependentiae bacterium]